MYARKLTLRHTFPNFSAMTDAITDGPSETHFGVSWFISMKRKARRYGPLLIFLTCYKADHEDEENPWSVSFNATLRIENGNEKDKIEDSLEDCIAESADSEEDLFEFEEHDWCTLENKYVKNNKLTVEIDVVIEEMEGFVPKRKRNFDAPRKHLTDMVLIVGDRKFNISKVVLGEFSDYFSSLFFNGCKETNQSEITLKEVDPDIFQMLLEVVYGDLECIQESTVEDLLVLARQYQVKVVTKRCAEFIANKMSNKSRMAFRLASDYDLFDLQDTLLESIKTKEDADERLSESSQDLTNEFIGKMMRKVYRM